MAEDILNKALINKRTQKKLSEFQYQLSKEMQELSANYTVLTGALLACDELTQKNMITDYRNQLYSVHEVLGKLCVMMDKVSRDF